METLVDTFIRYLPPLEFDDCRTLARGYSFSKVLRTCLTFPSSSFSRSAEWLQLLAAAKDKKEEEGEHGRRAGLGWAGIFKWSKL